MEVINQLYPSDSQMDRLKSSPDSGGIHLLNWFKFREKAELICTCKTGHFTKLLPIPKVIRIFLI